MFAFRTVSFSAFRLNRTNIVFAAKFSSSSSSIQSRIANLVKENKIVLFMKGTPEQPMCGFSKAVVQILDIHDVNRKDLSTHNVLDDEDVRQGKSFGLRCLGPKRLNLLYRYTMHKPTVSQVSFLCITIIILIIMYNWSILLFFSSCTIY